MSRHKRLSLFAFLGAAACALAVGTIYPVFAAPAPPKTLKSGVIRWDETQVNHADWGEMRFYHTGDTGATRNALSAVATVVPGKAVHKAHRHAEEEYLILCEGEGTWSLGGKEIPAKRGDMLFAEPWVYHGLTNTSDKQLVFIVVRYNSKGLPVPKRPDNLPDEL